MNPNRTFAADFLAVVAKFDGESDRGAVLVCSSYLEDLLKQLLRTNLKEGEGLRELFDGINPPLGSFSARIAACHAMGLIDERMRRDLHIVRKIRNEFAHNWDANLSAGSLADRCIELGNRDWEGKTKEFFENGPSPRQAYIYSSMAMFLSLRSDESK